VQGSLNAKTLFIYSISYFNLGGLGALFGVAKPTKGPRGDGTDLPAFIFLEMYIAHSGKHSTHCS